jgi:outer membrane murein-binding lipoprotein Lpp
MFKKLLIATLAVVVGIGLVSGTQLGRHLWFKLNKVNEWAKQQIPLSEEIERLKMEVNNLKQEDAHYFNQVAQQMAQVDDLKAKVNKGRAALAKQEAFIKEMRQALADENAEFVVKGARRFSRSEVEADVRREAIQFLADEKLLKADEENLAILKETLATNKAKLDGLALRRKEMEATVLQLERELAQLRLREQNNLTIDDGRYGRVGKEIEEARKRLAVEKAKGELKGEAQAGSIRSQIERQAETKKQDQVIEERFGKIETSKKLAAEN